MQKLDKEIFKDFYKFFWENFNGENKECNSSFQLLGERFFELEPRFEFFTAESRKYLTIWFSSHNYSIKQFELALEPFLEFVRNNYKNEIDNRIFITLSHHLD
jgi:hypothetical protein